MLNNFFGYTEHEIIGRKMVGTIPCRMNRAAFHPAAKSSGRWSITAGGMPAFEKTRTFAGNGRTGCGFQWTNKEVSRSGWQNIVESCYAIGNDQTERRRLEAQLRPGPEAGSHRHHGRGHRPRFQQHFWAFILGYSELTMRDGGSDASLRTKSLEEVCKSGPSRQRSGPGAFSFFCRQSEEEQRAGADGFDCRGGLEDAQVFLCPHH